MAYKTIEVEVDVDVDLDDFDTDDIIEELRSRVKKMSKQDKLDFREVCFAIIGKSDKQITRMVDAAKVELFYENIEKFTLEQFEAFINKL